MASMASPAVTRTLSVMFCPCNAPPRLYMLPQSDRPLIEDVLPQVQRLLGSLHRGCSAESFGMDDRLKLNVSDARAVFTMGAVLSLDQEKCGLPRNEYVSDIWCMYGEDACSFYGTVVFLVSYLDEDRDLGDIEVVFNFDAPYVRSLEKLRSEWKLGWADAQADGRKTAWSLRILQRFA